MRKTVLSACFILGLAGAAHAQAPGDFVEAPEKALVQKACTTCHVPALVTAQRKTPDQWAETVEKMVGMGAKVASDQDFETIVGYLAKYYGVAKTPPAGR
jgi:hypothetical protein